eukprot:CFRG1746T1
MSNPPMPSSPSPVLLKSPMEYAGQSGVIELTSSHQIILTFKKKELIFPISDVITLEEKSTRERRLAGTEGTDVKSSVSHEQTQTCADDANNSLDVGFVPYKKRRGMKMSRTTSYDSGLSKQYMKEEYKRQRELGKRVSTATISADSSEEHESKNVVLKDGPFLDDTHVGDTLLYLHVFQSATENKCVRKKKEYKLLVTKKMASLWSSTIQNLIQQDKNRPKHLLCFVNPHGGRKKAKAIYTYIVAPLLKLANVASVVVETERELHCTELCRGTDLTPFNGVLAVGGDGLFNEVLNGIFRNKTAKHIRVGPIPAGSTNTIVYSVTGCEDVVTSVYHVLVGSNMSLDCASVSNGDGITRLAVSMLSYGFYGDVMKDSENYRWMGPVRYDYSGFKQYIAHRNYKATILFKESQALVQDTLCENGCGVCYGDAEETTLPDITEENKLLAEAVKEAETKAVEVAFKSIRELQKEGWTKIRSNLIAVNAAVMSCKNSRARSGMSKFAHLNDHNLDLVLVRKCTYQQYLHHLLKLTHPNKNHFDFDFVDVRRVSEFILRSESKTSCWNVDGELLYTPDIHVKVHRNLIRLFARRPEPADENTNISTNEEAKPILEGNRPKSMAHDNSNGTLQVLIDQLLAIEDELHEATKAKETATAEIACLKEMVSQLTARVADLEKSLG